MENESLGTRFVGTQLTRKRYPGGDSRGGEVRGFRLTDTVVEGLPIDGRDRIIFDSLQPGFGVRVTPAGTKLFIAQARCLGRPRRHTVGSYPDKTVVEARSEARTALEDLRAGRDPKSERTARLKAIQAGQTTVRDFASRWFAEHVDAKLKPRTQADYRDLWVKHVEPNLGHLLVGRVARDDVLRFHSGMKRTPVRANRAASLVRAVMSYAEECGLRPPGSNPCRKLKMFREGRHERFLTEAEIAKAADAIGKAEAAGKIGPHAAAGLRLALFTGARGGEILAAKWSHVDWERRLIRLPDSKTGDPRTIHLSDAGMDVLTGLQRVGPYVIAGAKEGEPFKNLGRSWIVARKYAALDDVRLHDLRHSYASLAARRGISLKMIGELLGHKVPATTQRYAHLARDAVAAVNDELGKVMAEAIVKSTEYQQPGKVVRLPRRRARLSSAPK